ncbi:MAG: isochorismatase family cysteine hydrolase [Luteimonas sp.]
MSPHFALLILDMVGTFDFPCGAALRRAAMAVAPRLARFRSRVKACGGLCVYANDNFADWSSDFQTLLHLARQSPGVDVLEALAPETDAVHVLKPRHFAFHQTPVEHLLRQARVDTVLVTGVSTEACVLATALDARIREFDVRVVSDCVASSSPARRTHALTVMRHCEIPVMRAARALDVRAA